MPSTVVTDLSGRGVRGQQAARHRRAVEQHGAGAADAGAAHELGAGEAERVPDHIDQQRVGIVGQGSERPLIVMVLICDLQVCVRGIFLARLSAWRSAASATD